MIEITENSMYTKKRISKLLNKYTRGYYLLDIETIKKDYARFTELKKQSQKKKEKQELEQVCNYLNELLVTSNNQAIQATWFVADDKILTTPVIFKNFEQYGIDTINYILKRDDRTVKISYRDLWNVLALQMGHRDLDFSTKEIDSALTDKKITLHGLSDISILYELTTRNAYDELINLRIDQTPYHIAGKNGKYFINYFSKPLEGDTYKEALGSTIAQAFVIIIEQILEQIPTSANLELLGIIDDNIYFNTDMPIDEVMHYLANDLLVRAFGRNFEIIPSVTIY